MSTSSCDGTAWRACTHRWWSTARTTAPRGVTVRGMVRLAAGAMLALVATACGTHQGSCVACPTAAAGTGAAESRQLSRVSFRFDQVSGTQQYHPFGVHAWYDDGRGERHLPGRIISLPPDMYPYLADSGRYPTLAEGVLRTRAELIGYGSSSVGTAKLELALPLASDRLWTVRIVIARENQSIDDIAALRPTLSTSAPILGADGRPVGDVMHILATASPLSRTVVH